jgi:hypothetical protein
MVIFAVFAGLLYAAALFGAAAVLLVILFSVNSDNKAKREGYHPSSWHLHS